MAEFNLDEPDEVMVKKERQTTAGSKREPAPTWNKWVWTGLGVAVLLGFTGWAKESIESKERAAAANREVKEEREAKARDDDRAALRDANRKLASIQSKLAAREEREREEAEKLEKLKDAKRRMEHHEKMAHLCLDTAQAAERLAREIEKSGTRGWREAAEKVRAEKAEVMEKCNEHIRKSAAAKADIIVLE